MSQGRHPETPAGHGLAGLSVGATNGLAVAGRSRETIGGSGAGRCPSPTAFASLARRIIEISDGIHRV
eukprot:8971126-Pyramimonas_sp.AAC.1